MNYKASCIIQLIYLLNPKVSKKGNIQLISTLNPKISSWLCCNGDGKLKNPAARLLTPLKFAISFATVQQPTPHYQDGRNWQQCQSAASAKSAAADEKFWCQPIVATSQALVESLFCARWPNQILQTIVRQTEAYQNFTTNFIRFKCVNTRTA